MFGFKMYNVSVFNKGEFGIVALKAALAAYQYTGGYWYGDGPDTNEMSEVIDVPGGVEPPAFELAKKLLKWSRFPFYPGGYQNPSLNVSPHKVNAPKDWLNQWTAILPNEDSISKMTTTDEIEAFQKEGEKLFKQLINI